jgi:putative SOS response-associated peptidase YedK
MCGRYYVPVEDDDSGFQLILDQVKTSCKDSPLLAALKRGEIFPTDIVPAVTRDAPVLMKWGFSRFDAKGLVINARLETAPEKPMFKRAYEYSRCLLPAGYYFEWQKDGGVKRKYAIGTGAPITMAGLFRSEPDAPLPLFVILTRPAAPGISFIHDRMPVIVPEHVRNKWLSSPMDVHELLAASDEQMKFKSVG